MKYFIINADRQTKCTRNSNDLYVPFARKSASQISITYSGPKHWNTLPMHLNKIPELFQKIL